MGGHFNVIPETGKGVYEVMKIMDYVYENTKIPNETIESVIFNK